MTVENYARYPSLVDRTVFVTGGADGIGRATVQNFARQGSKVAFVDKNVEYAHATIESCVSAGAAHTPVFYEVDLLDIDALQAACRQAIDHLGGVTVLVNNAANDDRHTWEEMTVDYWNDRMNVNLRHYFFAIQALAPQMLEAELGSIVNVGSSSYMMQEDFFPGYAIAKSGVEGITRTMARTFGPKNVRVNTVLPGWVPTERQLGEVVVAGGRGRHDGRPGTQEADRPRRVRADDPVPRRRRQRRLYRPAVHGRRRKVLTSGGLGSLEVDRLLDVDRLTPRKCDMPARTRSVSPQWRPTTNPVTRTDRRVGTALRWRACQMCSIST